MVLTVKIWYFSYSLQLKILSSLVAQLYDHRDDNDVKCIIILQVYAQSTIIYMIDVNINSVKNDIHTIQSITLNCQHCYCPSSLRIVLFMELC